MKCIAHAASMSVCVNSTWSSFAQPLAHSSGRPSEVAIRNRPGGDLLWTFCDDGGIQVKVRRGAVVERGESLMAGFVPVLERRYGSMCKYPRFRSLGHGGGHIRSSSGVVKGIDAWNLTQSCCYTCQSCGSRCLHGMRHLSEASVVIVSPWE